MKDNDNAKKYSSLEAVSKKVFIGKRYNGLYVGQDYDDDYIREENYTKYLLNTQYELLESTRGYESVNCGKSIAFAYYSDGVGKHLDIVNLDIGKVLYNDTLMVYEESLYQKDKENDPRLLYYGVVIVRDRKTNKYGLLNDEGMLIVPCQFDEIRFEEEYSRPAEHEMIASFKYGKYIGYMDGTGKKLVEVEGVDHLYYHQGVSTFVARNDATGEGVINSFGRVLIPLKYKYVVNNDEEKWAKVYKTKSFCEIQSDVLYITHDNVIDNNKTKKHRENVERAYEDYDDYGNVSYDHYTTLSM